MTPKEVLIAARQLIADEKRWVKKVLTSVNKDGERCYCANGAILAAIGPPEEVTKLPVYTKATWALQKAVGGSISLYNDAETTTHKDMLCAIDKANGEQNA